MGNSSLIQVELFGWTYSPCFFQGKHGISTLNIHLPHNFVQCHGEYWNQLLNLKNIGSRVCLTPGAFKLVIRSFGHSFYEAIQALVGGWLVLKLQLILEFLSSMPSLTWKNPYCKAPWEDFKHSTGRDHPQQVRKHNTCTTTVPPGFLSRSLTVLANSSRLRWHSWDLGNLGSLGNHRSHWLKHKVLGFLLICCLQSWQQKTKHFWSNCIMISAAQQTGSSGSLPMSYLTTSRNILRLCACQCQQFLTSMIQMWTLHNLTKLPPSCWKKRPGSSIQDLPFYHLGWLFQYQNHLKHDM